MGKQRAARNRGTSPFAHGEVKRREMPIGKDARCRVHRLRLEPPVARQVTKPVRPAFGANRHENSKTARRVRALLAHRFDRAFGTPIDELFEVGIAAGVHL
jgi:hypothetical protein